MLCLPFRRRNPERKKSSQDSHDVKVIHKHHESNGAPEIKQSKRGVDEEPQKQEQEQEQDSDDYTSKYHFEDPCYPVHSKEHPPSYDAYQSHTSHPDFPQNAIASALRASWPPQPSAAEQLNRRALEEAEGEQGQYLSSIKYGDQLNRGLDELRRFQEDRMNEVGEMLGLTVEQIERRRGLSSWEGCEEWDIEEECMSNLEGMDDIE